MACQRGEAAARRTLFKSYFSFGKSICLRYAANVDEAEQLLHLGFARVFQLLNRYDPVMPFQGWFRGIFIRSCLEYHRREGKFEFYSTLGVVAAPVPATTIVEQIDVADLLYLVQQLPTYYRVIFALYVFDGYSFLQISELMGIPEATTQVLFEKARLKVQERIWATHPHLTPNDPTTPSRET